MALDSLRGDADALARHGLHEAAPWVRRLARLGYAAKGVVYVLLGGLALESAAGSSERPEDSHGALAVVLEGPFGRALLAVLAVGLAGYVLWRAVEAALDPEGHGSDAKGIGKRLGLALSAVLYGGLTVEAVRLLRGAGGGAGDGTEDWTARVLQAPLGRGLVGLAGAGVLAYGLYELRRAWTADLGERLDLSELGASERTWVVRFGRAGSAARGVVFVVIGGFLVLAALQSDAQEARGMAGALATLERQPQGPWLLGAVAAGLVAYGLFQLVQARYRRIRPL
jgi:hypothetical protein